VIDKSADTQYPIQDLLRQRGALWLSQSNWLSQKITQCFRSSTMGGFFYNEQPWSFIVATKDNQAEFDRLRCLAKATSSGRRTLRY